jgi:hypothetical protein
LLPFDRLAKRVVLDESYLKTKNADLKKKRDSLAIQALKKDIQAARKETSRLQASIQAEMQVRLRCPSCRIQEYGS